jgi:tetratricopeptide (TPR) repeat protein
MKLATLTGIALLASALMATPAIAQRRKDDQKQKEKEARAHYEKGQRHYNLGEFDQAIAEYKEAYALTSAPALLFNVAQAYRLKGDHQQALFFYRTYLREDPEAENAADVDALIADEEKAIAAATSGTGAGTGTGTVGTGTGAGTGTGETGTGGTDDTGIGMVDDDDLGTGTDDKNVIVKADKVIVNGPTTDVPDENRHPGRTKKILGLAGIGTGVVLGGIGLYFGKKAKDASNEITGVSDDRGQWNADHETTYSQGQNYETTEIVLLTAGGAFLAGGVVFYLLGTMQDNAAENATKVSVVPLSGGAGMVVTCGW